MSLNAPKSPLLQAANLRARKISIQPGEINNNNIISSNTALAAAAVTSVPRGGLGDDEEGSKDGPAKTSVEYKNEALKSISNCCRFALAGGVFGVASLLFENRSTLFRQGGGTITYLLVIDFFLHFQQIIFGCGLYRALTIFRRASEGGRPLDPASVDKLGQILSWMWALGALAVSVDAVALTWSFEPEWVRWLTLVLVWVSIPVCRGFHTEISTRSDKKSPAQLKYEASRSSGFNAALNMLQLLAALGVSFLVEIAELVVNTLAAQDVESKIGVLVGGLSDISESVIIIGLLATLYQQFIRATVIATQVSNLKSGTSSSFNEYFQAQTKFYSRTGSWFMFQLVFAVLPYIVNALVKPLLLSMGLQNVVDMFGL